MLSDPKTARRFPGPQLNPSTITRGSFYAGKSRDTKILDLPDHGIIPFFNLWCVSVSSIKTDIGYLVTAARSRIFQKLWQSVGKS